ncbi:retrovirus-related pol polyprotein from transposon TNT 1-94 [Tanacetum coccineum]
MHEDYEYVKSLEKEVDELESEKADFSNIYDLLLEECVSKDVTCLYLHSLSDLNAYAELQCLYLYKVKECECLAQKLSKQTESVNKEVHNKLLKSFAKLENHLISLELALQQCKEQMKNNSVCKENGSNVFRKEREQYHEIQDLKAQMQDKNIAIKYKISDMEMVGLLRDVHQVIQDTKASETKKIECLRSGKEELSNMSICLHRPLYSLEIVQLILFIVDSGCTKHMTGNLKLLCNFVEKFLEVAFRKSTCFVRDLQGNDLLTEWRCRKRNGTLFGRRAREQCSQLLSLSIIMLGLKQLQPPNAIFRYRSNLFISTHGKDGWDVTVLEGGPWLICKSPIILKKWSMDTRFLKEELTHIPIGVKLHDVPIQVFEENGNMEMKPDFKNMTICEYLEYEAAKGRRLWDDVRSRRSPTHYDETDFNSFHRNKSNTFYYPYSHYLPTPPVQPYPKNYLVSTMDSIWEQDDNSEEDQEEDNDDGDTFDMWDITVEDVERIRKFFNVPNEIDEIVQPLIPEPIHTTLPNDDYIPPATKLILGELLEEFGDEILNVATIDEETDFNPTKDLEELERLLAMRPQSNFTEIQIGTLYLLEGCDARMLNKLQESIPNRSSQMLYRMLKLPEMVDVAQRSRLGAWLRA